MHLDCPHCGQRLEYSGKRPSFCAYCGKPVEPVQLDRTGEFAEAATLPPEPGNGEAGPNLEAVGGYRLLRPLGAGGMGTVYEAEDVATGRHVALKLIAAEYVTAPDAVERFRREGRLASAVAHPRCVFVLAADEEAGRPYIVMELMPGTTLRDLVERQGPRPPDEAITKILDVIDGLREAHRLGVVHRDMKPSNCFLEADGRVKVGDFGLSKSLLRDGHLTQTGAFLGTPAFASPEQVRGEAVDAQSDLYSAAATLYYLLTGRAPFEGGDAAVTLARIVADPAPPMRSLRPELPQALDEVVLRGLERDRQRRWRDLDEFRAALVPFLPGRQTAAPLGVRFAAFLIDLVVVSATFFTLVLLVSLMRSQDLMDQGAEVRAAVWRHPLGAVLWLLYFAVPESLAGCSLGKWLLGLRVRRAATEDRPGLRQTVPRTLVYYLLFYLGNLASLPLAWRVEELPYAERMARSLLVLVVLPVSEAVGIGLLVSPMRTRNGYRGLHDWLTGTRVVRLPERETRRTVAVNRLDQLQARPADLPERLGAYAIRGALRWGSDGGVLQGEDTVLERRMVIHVRPQAEPPLGAARREVARPTRLRWLAGGRHDAWQWDAFLAPAGRSLPDLVAGDGSLAWSEVRPMLEQLAEELTAAAQDGTLPATLGVDQVWVQPEGRVQLLDCPLTSEGPAGPDAQPALALLAQAAILALEGQPPEPGVVRAPRHPVRAPVPDHAARMLARLLGVADAYPDVRPFAADLAASRDQPAEVTRGRRAAQLALSALLFAFGLLCCMSPSGWIAGWGPVFQLTFKRKATERVLRQTEQGAWQEFAASAVSADPLRRLRGAVQLDEDLRLRDRVRGEWEHQERERAARLRAMGWFWNWYTRRLTQEMDRQDVPIGVRWGPGGPPGDQTAGFRREAAARSMPEPETHFFFVEEAAVGLLVWPVVWVVWAFLWRGGLSYRWLGLSLVRSDGRRAARWQCAWRAVLVWGPLVALWSTALGVDLRYWSTWSIDDGPSWLPWISWALWWAGAALLPLHAVLAVLSPRRSLQDRLAGTYLVPR